MVISGCGSNRVDDAKVDARKWVGCIRARVSRRRTGPWRQAWRLLLASCALRLMYAPISRWDLQCGENPNGHDRDPIDPVGNSQWVKPKRTSWSANARTYGCAHLSVLRGINESTGSELPDIARSCPDRRCKWVVVGRCGVMRDCRAAEIIRELYSLVGADPPCLVADVALGWGCVIGRALRLLAR